MKSVSAEPELPVARVYDIKDCGPFNRFWANGKLVHNSGGDKVNLQNLNRGSDLRRSILAPEGHVLVVADSAQIEARTLAWLANQDGLVQAFAEGRDVYKEMASSVYGVAVDQVDKIQRFVGKVLTLGCGYGVGPKKLGDILRLGAMGPKVPITDDEAKRLVYAYRQKNDRIVDLWNVAGTIIQWLLNGTGDFEWGPMRVFNEHLVLPNGISLHYPGLHASQDGYAYQGRNASVKLYGGKLVENCTQALARIIVSDQMLKVKERYRIATMTHDEIVAVVPEREADEALAWMIDVMRVAPDWAAGLPLNAEGGYAREYSK